MKYILQRKLGSKKKKKNGFPNNNWRFLDYMSEKTALMMKNII